MTAESVDPTLDELTRRINAQAAAAYKRFQELLAQGLPPRDAMETVRVTFEGQYFTQLSAAFDKALDQRWPVQALRTYPVGDVTLSQALYANWQETERMVSSLVDRNARALQQARVVAMQLYTGYGLKPGEVLNFGQARIKLLPIELRELAKDKKVRDVLQVAVGRARAATLKTAALQSAYLQAFEAEMSGAAQAKLDRLLKVAMEEKVRYFANRIAETELARAHALARAEELMADDTIDVVQWRLSGTHPQADICDIIAKTNRWGLGPGCFPKHKAPRPIAHPHCRCRLRSRPDLSAADAVERPNAEQEYLDQFPDWEAARQVGSKAKLARVKAGEDPRDVFNEGKIERHQVPLLGDGGPGPIRPPGATPPPAPPAPPAPVAPKWDPPKPDPRGVMGVQEAHWHSASWSGGEPWVVDAAAKRQGLLKMLNSSKDGAYYSQTRGELNMPPKYTPAAADARATWRHEYGHYLDHEIGKQFSGMQFRFRSASADFTDAMEADAAAMLKRASVPLRTTAKTQALRDAYLEGYEKVRADLVDLEGSAAREAALTVQARALGFTVDELRASFSTQTGATLTGISGQVRMAKLLRAIEAGDAERFVYYMVEKDAVAEAVSAGSQAWAAAAAASRQNWARGNLGEFADLFGAMTNNKMLSNADGYFGHSAAYYKQRAGWGQQAEVFADLTSVAGGPDGVLWRIAQKFAPELSRLYEGIMRAAN